MNATTFTSASFQELSLNEMKSINGGQWIVVIINGNKTSIWLPE